MKLKILADYGVEIPSQEWLDTRSLEDLEMEYQIVLERRRQSEELERFNMYIQLGKNIIKIIRDDPSLKEKVLEGLPEELKQVLSVHL